MKVQLDGYQKLQGEKIIEKDSSTSSITTESDEAQPEFHSLNDHLKYILNSNKFHITIVCLVIIDCLLVIAELLLDLGMLTYSLKEFAPHVLHYASIAILCLFLIEIITKVAVFRLHFFKHKLEVFDAVVVVVSFVLDIVYIDNDGLETGIGLLIIVRLWRVARIVNGITSTVKKHADSKVNHEKHLRQAAENELTKYLEYCATLETEIEVLRQLLRKYGIRDVFPSEIPKPVSKMNVVAEVNQGGCVLHSEVKGQG